MREFRCYGPPGTGKTTWLAEQIRRALLCHDPEKIVACSFTRAAAVELASRDVPLPRTNVGTIHSLCYHALGCPPLADAEPSLISEWNDEHPAYLIGASSLDEQATANVGLLEWNLRRNTQDNPEPTPFAKQWEPFKRDHGAMDFTDLLLAAPQSLGADVLFVDEAQDLTPLQWQVVRTWGQHVETFVVVGDDDQILYGFMGADPAPFLSPLPTEQKRTLHHSYRVPRAIHAAAQNWIAKLNGRREPKTCTPRDADGRAEELSLNLLEANAIVDRASDHTQAGQTVMLLTQCAYMLAPVLAELRARGVPYANPYRTNRGDWNPIQATARRLLTHLDCWRAWEAGQDPPAAEWWRWIEMIDAKHLRRGLKKKLESEEGRYAFNAASGDFSPELLNACGHLEAIVPLMTSRFRDACDFPLHVYRKTGEAGLRNPPHLIVGTIHSVKGGEADVVYLFPDLSHQAICALDEQGQPARDALTRQVYVGMTRAREALYLCSAKGPHHTWR